MSFNEFEDTLKSFINDDDKLVTYKWLSKELEVHVNIAKDILKQYWEKYKDEENIVATFLLIGQLKDGSIRVEVVKESNLEKAKEKFKKVDCEHLYSLQKSLQDIALLAFAGEGDLRFSAIKCNADFVRSEEEIDGLRYIGNVKKDENKPVASNKTVNKVIEKQEPKKAEPPKEKLKNGTNNKNDFEKKDKEDKKEESTESKLETKAAPQKKTSPPTKANGNSKVSNKLTKKPIQSKQSGFNNLFGKASVKVQESNKSKEDSNDSSQKQKILVESTKKEVVENKNKVDEEKKKEESNTKILEKENKNKKAEEKSKNISKNNTKVDNKSKLTSKTDNRGKKRNRSQESNVTSKRKRVVVLESSEEDSNKSSEDEEPMEVEEEPPKVVKKRSPSPPAEKRENGKRMVRKTIDKTFKDEDGYLVTKRVHVYEAVSDNEEIAETKKEEPPKPKPVEVKAKKQTTLSNFFKKS